MLLEECGHPLISTSLNLPDIPYLNDPDEIEDTFYHKVNMFLDSGFGELEPSTVIDLTGSEPELIREAKGAEALVLA